MVEFKNGLCGCFADCNICICTYFCPCYVVGKTAEKVGESCMGCALIYLFVPLAQLVVPIIIRGKVREQKGIDGGVCGDCLVMSCLPCCGIIQSAQEVDALSDHQSISRE